MLASAVDIYVKKTPFQMVLKHYVEKGEDQVLKKEENSPLLFLPITDGMGKWFGLVWFGFF